MTARAINDTPTPTFVYSPAADVAGSARNGNTGAARRTGPGDTVEMWRPDPALYAGKTTPRAAAATTTAAARAPQYTATQQAFMNLPGVNWMDARGLSAELLGLANKYPQHRDRYIELAVAHLNELKQQGRAADWSAAASKAVAELPTPAKAGYRYSANGWSIGSTAEKFLTQLTRSGSSETKALVADKLFNRIYPDPKVLQGRNAQGIKFAHYNRHILNMISDPKALDEIHKSDKKTTAAMMHLASQEGRLEGIVNAAASYHTNQIVESSMYYDVANQNPNRDIRDHETAMFDRQRKHHTRRFGQLVGFAQQAIIRRHSRRDVTKAMNSFAQSLVNKLVTTAFKADRTGLAAKVVNGLLNKYMGSKTTDPKAKADELEKAINEAVTMTYFRRMYPNGDPTVKHADEYQQVNQRFQTVISDFRQHMRDGRGYF